MWHFLSFVVGIVFGSFLNVVIYRLPRKNLSVVKPTYSICPSCGEEISWYDNIPVLSYILLKGKCRKCKAKISPRYPFVELANGFCYLINSHVTKNPLEFIALSLIISCSLIIAFIDLEFMLIPDVTLFLIAFGSFLLWFVNGMDLYNFFGVGIVTGLLLLLGFLYKGGLGGGDVILMAALSLSLGIISSFYTLIFASVSAIIYALIKNKGKLLMKQRIPFGTFLAPAGYVVLLVQRCLQI
ncbi:prepilin peptidase [Thermotoga profunda]|uniref:prepilin peptidase n=1 Tax=Thermotoga profunda TaxID=1508420 RepID=UPI00059713A7|nr:A24 family peptidase [Thermotoga profunda]